MFRLVFSAASVFAAASLFIGGNMLLGTNVALRLAQAELGATAIGLILVQYSAGFVAGSLAGPELIRRVGHIRAFAAIAALTCCSALLYAAAFDPWLWALLRLVNGFCGAILLVILESWIGAHASGTATAAKPNAASAASAASPATASAAPPPPAPRPLNRGRLLGFYMMNYYLSGAAGQWLVGQGNPADFRPYSLAAGLLVASLVPLALTGMTPPAPQQSGRMPVRHLFRLAPLGAVGALFGGFASGAFYSLAPVHLARVGESTALVADYMACAVLASMLLQFPLGRLGDRHDRRRVITGIAAAAAIASLVIAATGTVSHALLFASTMLYTGVLACLYPACLAHTHEQQPGRNIVGANAGLLLCWGLGQCTGPVLVGGVMHVAGPQGLYYGIALALLGFVALALRLMRSGAAVPVLNQERSQLTPTTTPAIAELDPRTPAPRTEPRPQHDEAEEAEAAAEAQTEQAEAAKPPSGAEAYETYKP